jgi:cysteinyl-tRNA synthetase
LLENKRSLRKFGSVMGLLQQDPEEWFRWKPANDQSGLSDQDIETLITKRNMARASKDFSESDRIRDLLANENIILEDGATGTTWRRK